MRASLAILAVLALTLGVASLIDGGGKPAADGSPAHGPDVALRISAPDPARTLPQLTRRLAAESVPPEVSRAVRRGSRAIAGAGVDVQSELLDPLSFVAISLEPSCPPPAILACRPALRIRGRLRDTPPAELSRNLRTALMSAHAAAGFRNLVPESSRQGDELTGRLAARGESLARWRVSDRVLEIATGGLALNGARAVPRASLEREAKVEINRKTLAKLLGERSP